MYVRTLWLTVVLSFIVIQRSYIKNHWQNRRCKSRQVRIGKYLTVGRNHFVKPCFSKQRIKCMKSWKNTRFQAKSHGTEKSESATYGQDITPTILNGFGDKRICSRHSETAIPEGVPASLFYQVNLGGFLMMTVRNEIKAQIVRAGYTMQEVVDLLHEEYG